MSMKYSMKMMACGRQLTHKHHCASSGSHRTKDLHPSLLQNNIPWNVTYRYILMACYWNMSVGVPWQKTAIMILQKFVERRFLFNFLML